MFTDAYDKAREAALRILERRRRTRADVEKRLLEKGHAPADATAVCDRLEELRLLDDREFARLHLKSRAAKPRGSRLLLQELRAKGVPAQVAEEVLAEMAGAAEEGGARSDLDRARTLLRQASRKVQGLDPRAARQKLYQALARRGFDPDTISAAVEEWSRGE